MDQGDGKNDAVINSVQCMCVCRHCREQSLGKLAVIFDFIQQEIKISCPSCGEQNVMRGWTEFRSTPFPKIRTQR